MRPVQLRKQENNPKFNVVLNVSNQLQPADIGWPTGNGKKLSNCQACCLAQLCLDAA